MSVNIRQSRRHGFLKGKQKQIKTNGHHAGVGLFGVLDYETGDIMCDTAEQLNT